MRNGNRKFFREEVMHVYQRAINGFNIFYTLEDRLVFYTIFSVFLRRFNITALALCLMSYHFHAFLICGSRQTFYKFVSSVTSLYSRLFNESVSRKGRLFDKSFGSAPKMGEKQVRSAIPYLFNNPVEKNLCSDPQAYPWNFLAYLDSDNPFSDRICRDKCRRRLRRSLSEVDSTFSSDCWMSYAQLKRIYKGLSDMEKRQLTDYIIKKYLPFDVMKLCSYYKSLDMMKIAIRSNTGSEYNIREEYNPYSDTAYQEIENYISDKVTADIKDVISLSVEERITLAADILSNTNATPRQVAKYLHLVLKSSGA